MASLFKIKLLGYEKTSVNNYISKLNEEFHSVMNKMDKELETYKVECSDLQSVLMEEPDDSTSKKEGITCSNTADS